MFTESACCCSVAPVPSVYMKNDLIIMSKYDDLIFLYPRKRKQEGEREGEREGEKVKVKVKERNCPTPVRCIFMSVNRHGH